MKSVLSLQIGAGHTEMLRARARAVTQVRTHGTQRLPATPRGVTVQPGQGGALVTWHLPERYNDVTGYRVYTGTEKNLSIQIRDRGTRQVFVPLSAGATPPQNNIFVSVVNAFRESGRVQVQSKAQPDNTTPPTTGTPPTPVPGTTQPKVPQPTNDYLNMFSGGLDKTQGGQPTGKKTP